MRSYNLFRLESVEEQGEEKQGRTGPQGLDGAGLCCAVPETHAVPPFVTGGRWTFGGKVEARSTMPPGFDGRAAATAVRFNGYYLFQSGDRPDGRAAPETR